MPLRQILRRSVNLVPWSLRNQIRQVPIVAGLQRWLIARIVGSAPFLHEINAGPGKGLRLMITLPDDKGLWTGTYESDFVGAVAAAVKPGMICYDIGGFHGFVSGVMAVARARQVVCFEPLPANLVAIRELLSLNPGLPIEVRTEAVGAAEGQAHFNVMIEDSMGKLETSPFQIDQSADSSIPVTVRSLDSLLAAGEVLAPDLMKIDVEGAELDVLRGARGILAARHPPLFLEVHSAELRTGCEALLHELGYATRELARSGASAAPSSEISHLHAWGPGA